LQYLNALIGEVPTKYGIPIINFLAKIQEEQKQNG